MTGITALLLFAAWSVILMFTYVGYRTAIVFAGKKPADSWVRDRPNDTPGFFVRAQHAHANTLESLPVFAAIVLAAQALGRSAVVDPLALYVLLARLAQSAVHLIGVNHGLVILRGGLFSIQAVLFLYMILELLT